MRYFFAIAAVFVAVLLVFIVLKILPLLTAKPTIKKDYMAEYNKVTKPFDYDPNKNAAPYYKKTFDAFVEMPDTIEDCWQAWPTDLNDTELKIVEDWVASNRDAVSYVNQAAQKPYLWIERQCVDNDMFNFEISELPKLRELVWCISLQAKLSAIHGQPDSALNQLIELHKIGLHYSGPTSLVEQLVGIAIRAMAFRTAFAVMDREELSPEIMTDFQGKLQQQLQQRTKLNFSIGETIYGFDSGQHMFTDDGDGQGRLIPGKLYKYKKLSPMVPSISYLKAILIGMDHPGRRETLLALKNLYKVLDELVKETPWQLKQKGTSYQGQVKELTKGNYYLSDPINSFGTICELYHREKIHGQALVTTLALLRHEADNGGFPASLQVLLASNYIERLPIDPYSGSALVYKRQADNFTLYSLGANFTDNGGTPSLWGEEPEGEDEVFWPVE